MIVNEVKVIDNFLDKPDFDELDKFFDSTVPWMFSDVVSDPLCDPKYNFQYVHYVYTKRGPVSEYYNNMMPFLTKLDSRAIVRCKVNSICREEEVVIHGFHTDMEYPEGHPTGLDGMKTAILYLNTNDGFTYFEDETKVESVANRCVIFPAHCKHSGTTCTNVHRRLAINVVYF